MDKRTLLVVNPAARRLPSGGRLEAAVQCLRDQGWTVETASTHGPGHAIELAAVAAASRYDAVVACGGDGTVSEVANGLAGSDTALAVIPGGTANVWAKEVGIPRDPLAAADIVAQGETRRIDLGQANDRYFLLMAGVGFDGQVIHLLPARLKGSLGAAAYVLTALREGLRYRGQPSQVVMDGKRRDVQLLWLVAGNTRNYGGVLEITPHAYADDGLLDVCLLEGHALSHSLLHAARVLARRHVVAPRVTYQQVRRLEVSSELPLWSQLDGDLFTATPLTITVEQRALAVKLPAGRRQPILRD